MELAIGLGASLGPRKKTLCTTLARLDAHEGVDVIRVSRWYRSPPMHGGHATGWFLNGVARLKCTLTPTAMLDFCQQLEHDAGRRRALHWADRPLDIDLLVTNEAPYHCARLTLPHPGIASRPFVYWPLVEVWPEVAASITRTPPPRYGMAPVGSFARGPVPAYIPLPPAASEAL